MALWKGKVKGRLPEPQLITYKVINNNVAPSNEATPAIYKSLSFLEEAPSYPRGGRCGADNHPTGRETEKCGIFSQDTQQCSPQSFPAIDMASSGEALDCYYSTLCPLYFLSPPLLPPSRGISQC